MPRSPSRDLVDRFTGNRGYFHRADSLRRWKNGVALAAVGITLGWLIVEFAWPSRAISAHSHGELANPHAAFDANCAACHNPHSAGDFFSNPASVFRTHERWHDLTCTKCHAGPAHHANAKDGGAFHNQCSNCHHDHQGRDFSLVRIADSHCTKCHADLPAAHADGKTNFAAKITGFTRDHPEFRPLAKNMAEERRLKFSHALHMTPGLVYEPNDQHKWTAEELGKQFGPEARQRFTGSDGSTNKPVELNCAACHQLDAGRSEGAYYQPVNFDMHCKVCHPILTPAATSSGIVVKDFTVPHRQQPDALRKLLRGEYAARLAIDKHPAMATPFGPGGRLDPPNDPAVAKFGAEVNRLTDAAMAALTLNLVPVSESTAAHLGGFACGKCHFSTGQGKKDVVELHNKGIWFEHAKFNHVSHRGLKCADCHPGTEGSFAPGGAVVEREPPLIAGIKTCQACHAEAGFAVDLPNGQQAVAAGIRHSCTDCHRYHNGDHPRQGLGSPKRDPAETLGLPDWLNGKKKP